MFRSERLRALVEIKRASGLSIPAQASEINISADTLRSLICGNSTPSLWTFCAICDYYDVTPDWLLGYNSNALHVTLEVGR